MMSRRLTVFAAVVLGVVVFNAAAATAGSAPTTGDRIGPNQLFVGLVNGSTGAKTHAQIRVACPGPIRPGETTHPLAHQPLEVEPPATVATNVGHTGRYARKISAFLGIPPAADSGGLATFWHY